MAPVGIEAIKNRRVPKECCVILDASRHSPTLRRGRKVKAVKVKLRSEHLLILACKKVRRIIYRIFFRSNETFFRIYFMKRKIVEW